MKVICLTGGLASGKSTAVKHLAGKGAVIIDADILGHQAYNPGTAAFDDVISAFGEDVRGDDGQIDRKVLGGKVFGKPEELRKLTDIVWPEIRRLAELELAAIADRDPEAIVVLEAAVLFEAGWEDIGEEIWVLTVDRETAIARSMARDKAPRDAVERRLDSQLSNEVRTSRADVVVTNDSNVAAMLEQIDSAFAESIGPLGTG
ncbi:MAG: dephospho-CoA kinase [Gammaproteobacteria bacterium]|nr:dephospho-CoA kinase [Gammaproteobacteria bacterium]MBT6892540.1 dephospho-CoA kinase [Gammaproteobacteria bacterium]